MNKRLILSMFALCFALALVSTVKPVGAQGPVHQATVVPEIKHGIGSLGASSPDARAVLGSPRDVPRGRANPSQSASARAPLALTLDAALQTTLGGARMPSPMNNFAGMSKLWGVSPPDTNGDIGYDPVTSKKYYVQIVNFGIQVWDVTSTPTSVWGPVNLGSLWSSLGAPCSSSYGDPVVLFDTLANRWLISQFALPGGFSGPFYQCVAVSTSGNPTSTYSVYAFLVHATKMNDYPKFGVWSDGYYMSVDQWTNNGSTWAGTGAYVFDRANMLNGNAATFQYIDLPSLGGMLPSHLNGTTAPPAGSPNYFVQVDDDPANVNDRLEIWQFHVDWTTPANSTFTNVANPAVTAFNSLFWCQQVPSISYDSLCVTQPGTTVMLDNIGTTSNSPLIPQLMYRLNYRKFGTDEDLIVNHTVNVGDFANHAGVRWYELRKSGGTWSVYQQGTYAPDSNHRWMGSIAMDGHGNMALGYSVSSASVYPSIRYAGRCSGDSLNQLPQSEVTMLAGTGSQTNTFRWGDYSSMSVDPTDDLTFWYTNEYLASSGGPWQTQIGSFRMSNPPLPPPLPIVGPYIYYFPVIARNGPLSWQPCP